MSFDPIPISLVAHTVFCPRRAWLEVQGERVDSDQIELGHVAHRRVDDPRASRPSERRAVDIRHEGYGLVGKADLIRGDSADGVEIVEFKATPVRRKAEATLANHVQLTLQRLCLESMGIVVARQGVYFTNHETLVAVSHTREDVDRALAFVTATRAAVGGDSAPVPLLDDPRCRGCSHAVVCLPDEQRAAGTVRRISVSDPDGQMLHVQTQGARVSLNAGRVVVVKADERLQSVPLERVVGVVVYGNVDVSGALIRELLWRHLSLVWCSGRGRVVGWASTAESPNGQARIAQGALSQSGCLPLAREFISAKIANQGTQLRRGSGAHVEIMRKLQRSALQVSSLPELFAVEGEAAAFYFGCFPHLIKGVGDEFLSDWPGRRGRLAGDPLNVMLNFTYGLLLSDCIRALAACGLDPSAGFLHSSSRNKPALALDLMEEFRAPLADSVVLGAINNGEVRRSDFYMSVGDARLSAATRKALIAAYERRVDTQFRHPAFGYSVAWRRAIEVQARLILGWINGSNVGYKGIRIR